MLLGETRLVAIFPSHKVIGLTESERARYIAALKATSRFTKAHMETLGKTCDRLVAHELQHTRKEKVHAIDNWFAGI